MKYILILFLTMVTTVLFSQEQSTEPQFEVGTKRVNQCTPWHHLKCIYTTGTEVYEDGREGKGTRHWWRMSYIGRACTDKYGKTFGKIFEGMWVIPHYAGVGLGNGIGLIVYAVRGTREDVANKKLKRQEKRLEKKSAQLN